MLSWQLPVEAPSNTDLRSDGHATESKRNSHHIILRKTQNNLNRTREGKCPVDLTTNFMGYLYASITSVRKQNTINTAPGSPECSLDA
jgi:hypothetical protein